VTPRASCTSTLGTVPRLTLISPTSGGGPFSKLWFAPGGYLRRDISPFRYAHVGALRCEIATKWALYADLLLFFVISARQAAHQCSWWCICVQQKLWFASCGRLRREIASFGFAHALHHGLGRGAVKWPSFEANCRCVSRGGLKLSLVGRASILRPFLASPPRRFHGVRRPQTTFFTENGRPQWTPRTRLKRQKHGNLSPYARKKPGSPFFLHLEQLPMWFLGRFETKSFVSLPRVRGLILWVFEPVAALRTGSR
jgi:hypothetical protein